MSGGLPVLVNRIRLGTKVPGSGRKPAALKGASRKRVVSSRLQAAFAVSRGIHPPAIGMATPIVEKRQVARNVILSVIKTDKISPDILIHEEYSCA